MANCKQTPQDFIKNAFTPQIAVLCSPAAEQSCNKNNLSFTELLQPFCKLGTEVQYKEPDGTGVVTIKNLKISLVDINTRPPQPTLARKFLNSSVSEAPDPRQQTFRIQDYSLEIPSYTPWFESWRDTFLQVQFPSDHEFTKHYLACMLVVSTSEVDPLQTMTQLVQRINQMQNVGPTQLPKWFNKNTLYYYVIVHENLIGNHVSAVETFDGMKKTFGANNCFLLHMNSRPPGKIEEQLPDPWSQFINTRIQLIEEEKTPDSSPSTSRASSQFEVTQKQIEKGNALEYHPLSPEHTSNEDISQERHDASKHILHGVCLTTEDVEQIKLLIYEFCTRALLPYVEKQIKLLTDFVANKKGVSKSLFSATKRWFAPNKPGSSTASNSLVYSPDSAELQIRRLADLYFMFGHYEMAFECYVMAKKDFITDQAWLYYSGILEMAALSSFMANEASRKIYDYMEESIITYLGTCRMAQFATRATLLSSECLKKQGLFGEAANQLIRMTSEESDLRSALLLEQAAYCFLNSTKPPMVRKYAFHMVLAGHRFSKASQRRHSLRCYKQAYQVYQFKGWKLAEDHINYTIGRQANNLHILEVAVGSYTQLFRGQSKQPAQQQAIFLKEYLTTYSILLKKQHILVTQILPLPALVSKGTKVLICPTAPLTTPGKVPAMGISIHTCDTTAAAQRWSKLEEMLVQEAQGSLPMLFKPLMTLFAFNNLSNANPIAVVGEPIQVSVILKNSLQILLHLKDIYLLWQYKDGRNNRFAANEITGNYLGHSMKTHDIKSLTLQANCAQDIILTITPLAVGEVFLKGICYGLMSSNTEDQVSVKGKQIFNLNTSKQKESIEKRFKITVVPALPCLQVSFCEVHTEMLRNELQEVSVELRNIGGVPIHNVYIATSVPHLISSSHFEKEKSTFGDISELETIASREKEARKNHVSRIALPKGILELGQYHNISIWIKAPDKLGPAEVDLLIYYENLKIVTVPRYRVIRHMWSLQIHESIKSEIIVEHSTCPKNLERLIFSTTVYNVNKTYFAIQTEITFIKAGLLSNRWTLNEDFEIPTIISIHSQEYVNFLLKADRKISTKSCYSEVSFDSQKSLCSDPTYLDFVARSEQYDLNMFEDLENVSKLNSLEATLVLKWSAVVTDKAGNARTVYGQSLFPIEHVEYDDYNTRRRRRSSASFESKYEYEMYNLTYKDGIPFFLKRQILYTIEHPIAIDHNFQKKKLCIIPVKLLMHNVSEVPVTLTIKTLLNERAPLIPKPPSLFQPNSSNKFRWIKIRNVKKQIEARQITSIDLLLAVLSPGTYDLGALIEIWSHQNDERKTAILQLHRNQSALIVANVSS